MKRYFITNQLKTKLPNDFVNSKNNRFISMIQCRLYQNLPDVDDAIEQFQTPKFISVHANIIHCERYLDSYVMYCNEQRAKPKKYEQLSREYDLELWFKNYDGTPYDTSENNTQFLAEFLLEY
jgi:hypothetical protein